MKKVLIIQARMGSTRLAGKSLMKLANSSLLQHILDRVSRVKNIDEIVFATSVKEEDNKIEEFCQSQGVACFRGSENDLVDRYYQASIHFEADLILRLPADNPCPEAKEYDRLINYHESQNNDFSSNICNFRENGYPDGIGVEIFSFKSLERIWRTESDVIKREHVNLNYYDYGKDRPSNNFNFKIGTIKCPKSYSRPDIVLDINTLEDYNYMKKLFDYAYHIDPSFGIKDIIKWHDNVHIKEI